MKKRAAKKKPITLRQFGLVAKAALLGHVDGTVWLLRHIPTATLDGALERMMAEDAGKLSVALH